MSSSSKNPKTSHHGAAAAGPQSSSPAPDQQKHPQRSPLPPLNHVAHTNSLPPIDIPPPPPAYGFHMLDRRTIVLADGSVRSYFALPPDHALLPHVPGGGRFGAEGFRDPIPRGGDYWSSLGLDGPSPSALKRKHAEEEEEEYARRFGPPRPFGNPGFDQMGRAYREMLDEDGRLKKNARLGGASPSHEEALPGRGDAGMARGSPDVDPQALKRAFLRFSKLINESAAQKKNLFEDGKYDRISCLACGRASKEFSDLHELIVHTYTSQNADLRVDHLGLHKALCVLMGWSYTKAPDDSKSYRTLSPREAAINREDLIIWPPNVLIHNALSRRKDGGFDGIGNKEMDKRLKELGFSGGKSKAMYGKEGYLGMTIVKFANSQTGLKEAEQLADFFEKEGHGRSGWAQAEPYLSDDIDDHHNPKFFAADKRTGVRKRIFYGYLATAFDLDKLEFEIRKKAVIKSRREFDLSE